jgi:hypothetical protein
MLVKVQVQVQVQVIFLWGEKNMAIIDLRKGKRGSKHSEVQPRKF